jgi:hypothetical protein
MFRQDAAYPDRRGHLVFRGADAFADQVFGFPDTGCGVDIDAGMAEEAGREDRYGDKGPIRFEQRDRVGRQRHLRHVELAEPHHAEESLFDRHVQIIEVDPVRLHRPVHQGAGAVVVPAAERQSQFTQSFLPVTRASVQ